MAPKINGVKSADFTASALFSSSRSSLLSVEKSRLVIAEGITTNTFNARSITSRWS